jgi:ABC-2 type transport system ATP-binding protein
MRLLCGLSAPDSGTATIDGTPYTRLPQPGRRVGVMLDPTAMHVGRSGRETLALSAAVLGTGSDRVAQILQLVGLDGKAAAKRVGQYSLGMRQRLALGNALLGDPGILVLDEPANGLDPQGIHWMRTLLREFADRGGTVLLSSHLLHEVEEVADRLVIISQGRIVADEAPAQLLGARTTLVRGLDPAELAAALRQAGLPVTGSAGDELYVDATAEQVGRAAAAREPSCSNSGRTAPTSNHCSWPSQPPRRPSTPRSPRDDRHPVCPRSGPRCPHPARTGLPVPG